MRKTRVLLEIHFFLSSFQGRRKSEEFCWLHSHQSHVEFLPLSSQKPCNDYHNVYSPTTYLTYWLHYKPSSQSPLFKDKKYTSRSPTCPNCPEILVQAWKFVFLSFVSATGLWKWARGQIIITPALLPIIQKKCCFCCFSCHTLCEFLCLKFAMPSSQLALIRKRL